LDTALRENFGFDGFRAAQREVIESVLAGRDTVVVMPTGSGKSLCYQLPALMKEGATVVVSPLIALMKDQVDALLARNLPATFINSTLTPEEQRERIRAIAQGVFKLVYVAPERFRSQYFTETLREMNVTLFAVDEAHCISQWGHDFRPDFLRLKDAAQAIGRPQIVALTATATPYVRADIAQQLALANPSVFVSGFDRPNLFLEVLQVQKEREKVARIKQLARNYAGGSGIVYAATRKAVESITPQLQMAGLRAVAYHAGLTDEARARAQDAFMSGAQQIIVATNAFGMGIDKPDIRFVAHYQVPGSLEAYYQEIGRAGRDGLPATCAMLFNYADKRTQEFFIDGSYPPPETITDVYRALAATGLQRIELSVSEIAARAAVRNDMAVQSALIILEKAGHIERGMAAENRAALRLTVKPDEARAKAGTRDTQARQTLLVLLESYAVNHLAEEDINLQDVADNTGLEINAVRRALGSLVSAQILSYTPARRTRGVIMRDWPPAGKLRINAQEIDNRAALERRKLREMISFCYEESCYRAYLLDYFGDKHEKTCGGCSNCVATETPRPKVEKAIVPVEEISAPTAAPTEFHINGPRPLTPAETLMARKILACAARLEGRFGKNMLAAVLRGSREKKLLQANLDTLSTYNILAGLTHDELMLYIDALHAAGCLRVTGGSYPTVTLTPYGGQVMREQARVELALAEDALDAPLDKEGKPPRAPTLEETYRLYQEGLTLAEIAATRNLKAQTIENHLADCIKQGREFDLSRFVNEADRALILQAAAEHGAQFLKPIRDALPAHISYGMIRLTLAAQEYEENEQSGT
jgi:ATP-dependent DNA helicase RecQ